MVAKDAGLAAVDWVYLRISKLFGSGVGTMGVLRT